MGRLNRNAAREVNINSTSLENALLSEALKLYRAVTLIHIRCIVKDKVLEPIFTGGWVIHTRLAMLHAGVNRLLVNRVLESNEGWQ